MYLMRLVLKTMNKKQTEYYFSAKILFVMTIFFASIPSGILYLFLLLYKENLFASVFLALPMVPILLGLPIYVRYMYCAITKRPALVLNSESLINNANGKVYSWSQIKLISYEPNTGKAPGHHISITLRDPESKFRIQQNVIRGKSLTLLRDLQKYHRAYHREEYERKTKETR